MCGLLYILHRPQQPSRADEWCQVCCEPWSEAAPEGLRPRPRATAQPPKEKLRYQAITAPRGAGAAAYQLPLHLQPRISLLGHRLDSPISCRPRASPPPALRHSPAPDFIEDTASVSCRPTIQECPILATAGENRLEPGERGDGTDSTGGGVRPRYNTEIYIGHFGFRELERARQDSFKPAH